MCIMNTGKNAETIRFDRFNYNIKNFTKAQSVTGSETLDLLGETKIPGTAMWVLELKK